MTGIGLVVNERIRQFEELGYTSERDDEYEGGELLSAASAYIWWAGEIQDGASIEDLGDAVDARDTVWPFIGDAFKPEGGSVRNLTKAAGLICAEIDRLQRLEKKNDDT